MFNLHLNILPFTDLLIYVTQFLNIKKCQIIGLFTVSVYTGFLVQI